MQALVIILVHKQQILKIAEASLAVDLSKVSNFNAKLFPIFQGKHKRIKNRKYRKHGNIVQLCTTSDAT